MLINLSLLSGSLVVGLIILEVVLRTLTPFTIGHPRELYRNSKTLGYEYRPRFEGVYKTYHNFNTKIKINSKGLRDYEYPYDKPEGVVRILVLGDSFTAGLEVGMEDTYPKVLERLLNDSEKNKNRRYEVINAGVPGYSTVQELQYLKEHGIKYEPDLVIVGFCMTNDYKDNYFRLKRYVEGNQFKDVLRTAENGSGFFPRVKVYLRKHTLLYPLLVGRLKQSVWLNRLLVKFNISGPSTFEEFQINVPGHLKKVWGYTEEILREMNSFSREHSARLTVVMIPFQYQMSISRWQRDKNKHGLDDKDFYIDNPQRVLSDICRKENIPVFDLTNSLREQSEKTKVYIENDGHWTKHGHEYAAKEIYRYLINKDIIDGK